jgi:hypothetical protein
MSSHASQSPPNVVVKQAKTSADGYLSSMSRTPSPAMLLDVVPRVDALHATPPMFRWIVDDEAGPQRLLAPPGHPTASPARGDGAGVPAPSAARGRREVVGRSGSNAAHGRDEVPGDAASNAASSFGGGEEPLEDPVRSRYRAGATERRRRGAPEEGPQAPPGGPPRREGHRPGVEPRALEAQALARMQAYPNGAGPKRDAAVGGRRDPRREESGCRLRPVRVTPFTEDASDDLTPDERPGRGDEGGFRS